MVKDKHRLRYRLFLNQIPYDKSRRYSKITEARIMAGIAAQIQYKTLHNNYSESDVRQWRNAGLISPRECKIFLVTIGKAPVDTEIEEFYGGEKIKQIRRLAIDEFITDMVDFNPEKADITTRLRLAILNRDRSTCQVCGKSAPTVEIEVDHIVPFSKGGKTKPENLQTVCRRCNIAKSNKFKFHINAEGQNDNL